MSARKITLAMLASAGLLVATVGCGQTDRGSDPQSAACGTPCAAPKHWMAAYQAYQAAERKATCYATGCWHDPRACYSEFADAHNAWHRAVRLDDGELQRSDRVSDRQKALDRKWNALADNCN